MFLSVTSYIASWEAVVVAEAVDADVAALHFRAASAFRFGGDGAFDCAADGVDVEAAVVVDADGVA